MSIRVLLVDDSAFVRKALRRMLEKDADFAVVGEAADGQRGLELARQLRPDVMTLDLRMPGWDGLYTLTRIMEDAPTSIVIVSSLARAEAELTLRALTGGAVEVIDKSRVSTMALYELEREIIDKLKAAASSNPLAPAECESPSIARPRVDLFVLGASTGGPRALELILARLPEELEPPVLIVQHMPAGFTGALAARLDTRCALPVRELEQGDPIAPVCVHIAPGGADLRLERSGAEAPRVEILPRTRGERTTPSIDLTLETATACYGDAVCAVILTGMGDDGLEGTRAVRRAGGRVIAEAASTCVVYGMPRTVAEAGLASAVAPLDEIPALIVALAGEVRRSQ